MTRPTISSRRLRVSCDRGVALLSALLAVFCIATVSAQTTMTLVSEDFATASGVTAPGGWTAAGVGPGGWRFDNPAARAVPLGITPPFAIVDSDAAGNGFIDATLTSPGFDVTGADTVTLEFDYQFQQFSASVAEVIVDNGTTSTVVFTETVTNTPNAFHPIIDITAAAAGSSSVTVAFRYQGDFEWWWMVDNVTVTAEYPPPPPMNEVRGRVFRDFNGDGLRGDGEVGVAGVMVQAVDSMGGIYGPIPTGADGSYSVPVPNGTEVRVEYTNIPAGLFGIAAPDGSASTIQFVTSPVDTDAGVNHPTDHTQDDPGVHIPCFVYGDPTIAGTAAGEGVIVNFQYGISGQTTQHSYVANAGQVGSVWGVAYQRTSKKAFTSAVLKRHCGFSTNGPGAIFVTDYSQPTTSTQLWFRLNDIMVDGTPIDVGADPHTGLPGNENVESHDDAAYAAAGKVSLGDIDISDDETTLWVANLADKTIYEIPIGVLPTDISSVTAPTTAIPHPIEGPTGIPGLPDVSATGQWRPWGTKFYRGKVYVGLVADASISGMPSDLRTRVYAFDTEGADDPMTSGDDRWSLALEITDMTYPRGGAANLGDGNPAAWNAWTDVDLDDTDDIYGDQAQPICADIEFSADGCMILGFIDRQGLQLAIGQFRGNGSTTIITDGGSAGDVQKASPDPMNPGQWILENNATAGSVSSSGAGNMEGPGGGEFFFQDNRLNFHEEVAAGSLAFVPGKAEVTVPVFDPITCFSGGIQWMSTRNGTVTRAYEIYIDTFSGNDTPNKGLGLGDIEALFDPAPIQVGNRVWADADGNGIQDPGELGIDGVTVTLCDENDSVLATTMTASGGHYLFTDNDVTGGIPRGAMLKVCLSNASDYNGGPLDGMFVTQALSGSNGEIDSNGSTEGPTSTCVLFASGGHGENTHALDFGFASAPSQGKIGNFVWMDAGEDGTQDAGTGVNGVTVNLLDSSDNSVLQTAMTDANGEYCFDVDAGTYCIQVIAPMGLIFTSQGSGGGTDSDTDSSGKTNPITITAGQVDLDSGDAGLITAPPALAKIGNYVWLDAGDDGAQDAGAGVSGVTVNLYDSTGMTVLQTAMTDSNGEYCFSVDAGTYCVEFLAPMGHVFTTQGSGSATDSDVNTVTGKTASITVTSGQVDLDSADAGLVMQMAKIGNYVWLDDGEDGVQEASAGVSGVSVNLYTANSMTVLQTTMTDVNGEYCFMVDAGSYCIEVVVPTGMSFTTQGTGGADDSDVDPTTGKTGTITVASGDMDLDSGDAGVIVAGAKLGNYVWLDAGEDGAQDAGAGVASVSVTLYDAMNVAVATTMTDVNGEYCFADLMPGDYCVEFTAPAGMVFTTQGSGGAGDSDVDPTTGKTGTITLIAGQIDLDSGDAGLVAAQAKIGNYVWLDNGDDGVQEAGAGVSGVTVNLYDGTGTNVLATAMTDANGEYCFNVDAGTYCVEFVAPMGHMFTTQAQGGNGVSDSDVDMMSGKTDPITVAAGDVNLDDADAGLVLMMAKIGNYVWLDDGDDGVQEAGAGVSGVTVNLYDSTGTSVLQTAMTDANGEYCFLVDAGTYCVEFVAPMGHAFTTQTQGGDGAADSDIDMTSGKTDPITVAAGDVNLDDADAGLVLTMAKIGNYVWLDDGDDGVQEAGAGVSGVTVNLFDSTGMNVLQTAMTDANGEYCFLVDAGTYCVEFVAPTGHVFTTQAQGGDGAADSDVNMTSGKTGLITVAAGDVSLDAADAGLVLVDAKIGNYVWLDNGDDGVQEAGAGVSGVTVNLYDSTGMNVLQTAMTDANGEYCFTVDAGTYCVEFVAPTGHVFTTQAQGGDGASDSDVNMTTGKTDPITVMAGDVNLADADAGLIQTMAKIGNYVWLDNGDDGVQESAAGVSGVVVNLFDGTGVNMLGTMMTDANGEYCFNVLPGTYCVEFIAPAGFGFTTEGSGGAVDSDVDMTSGKTAPIMVVAGQTDFDSADAGLVMTGMAKIGNYVFRDADKSGDQSVGDTGLPNIVVNLLDAAGMALVQTTTTDANGEYCFAVTPGTYVVEIERPDGYTISPQGSGGSTDSDIDATGKTAPITVAANAIDNDSADAGFEVVALTDLPALVAMGDRIDYCMEICTTDPMMKGVVVVGFPGVSEITVAGHDLTVPLAPGWVVVRDTYDANMDPSDDQHPRIFHFNGQTTLKSRVGFIECIPALSGLELCAAFVAFDITDMAAGFMVSNGKAFEISDTFGDATDRAAFLCGSMSPSTDWNVTLGTAGPTDMKALAVCGDITMNSSTLTVGDMFPTDGSRTDLVVQGSVAVDTLNLPNGNGIYGGTSMVTNLNAPLGWNLGNTDAEIDCTKTADFMKLRAKNIGLMEHNGMCQLVGTNLKLTGFSQLQNIFLVNPAQWAAATSIEICAPVNAVTIINVCGQTVTTDAAGLTWNTNGIPASRLIVNFQEATSLSLTSTSIPGTLHAPCANITLENVTINGQFFGCDVATVGTAPITINAVPFNECLNWHMAEVLGNGAVD